VSAAVVSGAQADYVRRQQDYISGLSNVYTCYGHRGSRERLLLAMLTAYFDESGMHSGDHLCVVAGFVGNDAQWCSFAADWIKVIEPRPNLHLRRLKWNRYPERIAPLLESTGLIPERYNLKPVAVGMHWRDYEASMKGQIRPQFANPYMLCAESCMSTVLTNIAGSDDVLFIFDRQHVHKGAMNRLRDFVFGVVGVDSRIKGCDFLPSKATVCLDPADYLAYMIREEAIDSASPRFAMGKSILGTKGGDGGIFNSEEVAEMAQKFLSCGMGIGDTRKIFLPEMFTEIIKNPYWRGPK
jgi:hypothetical protein